MTTRIASRRSKIMAYNSLYNLTPLVFEDSKSWGRRVSVKKSDIKRNPSGSVNVRRLVLLILDMTNKYSSINKITGRQETVPGRYRSVIDIWRHAIDIVPDVDIYRVMEVLFVLCSENEVYGQFCQRVKRAVFYINKNKDGSIKHTNQDMDWVSKEYGIKFSTWEKLHETVKR